jgi:hypothetical protein
MQSLKKKGRNMLHKCLRMPKDIKNYRLKKKKKPEVSKQPFRIV